MKETTQVTGENVINRMVSHSRYNIVISYEKGEKENRFYGGSSKRHLNYRTRRGRRKSLELLKLGNLEEGPSELKLRPLSLVLVEERPTLLRKSATQMVLVSL